MAREIPQETPQEATERLTANLVAIGWPRAEAEIVTRRASETAAGIMQAAVMAANIAGELAADDLGSEGSPLAATQCRSATLFLLVGRLSAELVEMSGALKAAGAIVREPMFKEGE